MASHVTEAVRAPGQRGERRLQMSYEACQEWTGGEERTSAWVAGEVIVFMATTSRHADIVGFLYALLLHVAQFRNLGRVFAESLELQLATAARIPDILFLSTEHLDRLKRRG